MNSTPQHTCPTCHGLGKRTRRLRKKGRLLYQKNLDQHIKNNPEEPLPIRPKGASYPCSDCKGSGLISATTYPTPDINNYPHIAIIGGGIGGTALALACLHRGIPFTLYERDNSFDDRAQGYGLTLQQATTVIAGLGIASLKKGIVSTRHVVHNTEGKILGEWGMRKWLNTDTSTSPKRTNIHIARQSLRYAMLEQLGTNDSVKWGHQLIDIKENKNDDLDQPVKLSFKVNGEIINAKADLVVGADGIRSAVRRQLIGEQITPLRYLGCIVILGICPLSALGDVDTSLLDSATVFQTANGNERIYMMPFSSDTIMWQLSFPMSEIEAKELSAKGVKALKKEACLRTPWHDPIPQIMEATSENKISGYPVYDRELLDSELLTSIGQVTLIGDAAHPMSPFKGQGANQALLDALALARKISRACRPRSQWKEVGIRKSVLSDFESEMLSRSSAKVKDSAEAAEFLHSEVALHEADEPRGKNLKKK